MILLRKLAFGLFFAGVPAILSLQACSSASPCERVQYSIIDLRARCTTMSDAEVTALKARVPNICKIQTGIPGTTGLADLQSKCAFDLDKAQCGGLPPNCTSFVGTLATAQPCGANIQCKSGSCGLDKPMGLPAYCGHCQDRGMEMAGCKVSSDCVPGLICLHYMDMVTMMDMGVCTKANGQVGDPCLVQEDCRGPNHCAAGKCAAPVKKNDPCQERVECEVGLVCNGRCTTPTGLNGSCMGGDCDKGLECDPKTKLCAKVGYAAPGAACDGVLTQCTRGPCTNKVCLTYIADGQACDPMNKAAVCDSAAVCVDGTCQIPDARKCGGVGDAK